MFMEFEDLLIADTVAKRLRRRTIQSMKTDCFTRDGLILYGKQAGHLIPEYENINDTDTRSTVPPAIIEHDEATTIEGLFFITLPFPQSINQNYEVMASTWEMGGSESTRGRIDDDQHRRSSGSKGGS